MRIQKKRIVRLAPHLPGVQVGTELLLVAPLKDVAIERLGQVGFSASLSAGEKVLPAILGPVSRFNAEGSFIRHRDKPKETFYRQREHHYKQWHGRDRVDATKIVAARYQRYPRTPIAPYAVELSLVELPDGSIAVATSETITLDLQHPKKLLHSINLMLELFGFCDVVDKHLVPTGVVPTISLNWQVLPPGEMPWVVLEPSLRRVLAHQKERTRPVVEHRLKEINRYRPKFVAVGHGGFTGYIVFGFPESNLYILECTRYGNATYIFENNWKEISRLTKAEILSNDYHKARIIHQSHWERSIRALLRNPEPS